ncbi:MAG: hypothetical protein OEU92_14065 [Alphaproteobacteria bacterium]|nr:hypothetical protein [Alphaproteobacteria bacterium]
MEPKKRSFGASIAGEISALVIGFMAAWCRWFEVTPDSIKKPGARGNAPPPSGGISSLG